jgi:spoIIIJ-associated protein
VGTASIEEQVQLAEEFLRGLLEQFGSSATVSSNELTDGVVELVIDGDNLGTLIGPRGATLLALQELTRTVLQHRVGSSECRVVVDVNGYRKRRQDALARFAQQVAAEVRESNTRRALEPMPPADRKVVHDAVNAVPGVSTTSEGEEPYRRVVLIPVPPEGEGTDEQEAPDASQLPSESVSS